MNSYFMVFRSFKLSVCSRLHSFMCYDPKGIVLLAQCILNVICRNMLFFWPSACIIFDALLFAFRASSYDTE